MTANLNGIRSAASKGFFSWFQQQDVDVLCIQETKAQEHQLQADILAIPGYSAYFHDATRPGYSGVALYTRQAPNRISFGIGLTDLDQEGRYIQADWSDLSIASVYVPSGTSGPHRQEQKERYISHLESMLRQRRNDGRRFIICGDLNIAHKEIDLKNWRSNQNTPGFLPHERAWLDKVFDDIGMCDAFRLVDPNPDRYTWWSMRAGARANNVGWRIDYHLITPNLRRAVMRAEIAREPYFSDHAPLTIEYEFGRSYALPLSGDQRAL